jgi:hypothetical protein
MRVTIHLCSREDYWPLVAPLREARRSLWLRARRGVTEETMAAGAETLRAELAHGPLKRKEIDALVGKEIAPGVGLWVDLVRVPPSGTWERRRADLYGLADDWLAPRADPDPDDALDHLVSRYLTGFGPAAKADIANWAGLAVKAVEPALERLPLNRFRAEDGTELLDLPGAPLPGADTPAPVRFLPTWDAVLLAHARRTQVLPEAYRAKIFHVKMPQSIGTFLVDGAVAGTWRPDGTIEPFEDLGAPQRKAVDTERRRLLKFCT